MFDLYEELTKIEIVLSKEIEIYKILLEYEEKKVLSILDIKLQDINMFCDFQHKQMIRAIELRNLREKYVENIVTHKMSHLADKATLSDIVRKFPFNKTAKISSLRLELVTVLARLKQFNKLVPKLFDDALDIFGGLRDVLTESKKIGYDNRGKEHILNRKMSVLINKQV